MLFRVSLLHTTTYSDFDLSKTIASNSWKNIKFRFLRKLFKQWWSTILPISTQEQSPQTIQQMINCNIWCWKSRSWPERGRTCNGVKPVNGIPTLLIWLVMSMRSFLLVEGTIVSTGNNRPSVNKATNTLYHIFYWNNAEFACVIKA